MSATRQSRFPPGAMLDDKYQLGEVIGSGGMGTVYQAVHLSINRKVAVKILSSERLGDTGVVSRFLREARTAGELGSDNICEVTDLGTTPRGTPYFVMPLLRGSDLGELVSTGGLTFGRSLDIADQVLSALEVCHAAGIVHRDLKPANIFITKVGDRDNFVKVLDFGISKVLRDDGAAAVTLTGEVLGTPYYMSPEQAAGQEVDHRCDLYSLGVVLYELLSGRRPYSGSSYNEIIYRISNSQPIPVTRLNPAVPPTLAEVVSRAMARDPRERFASASQFRAALAVVEVDPEARPLVDAARGHTPAEATVTDTPLRVGALAQTPPTPVLEATWARPAKVGVAALSALFIVLLLFAWEFAPPPPVFVPARAVAADALKPVSRVAPLSMARVPWPALEVVPLTPTIQAAKPRPTSGKRGPASAPATPPPPRIPGRAGAEISASYE